MHVEPIGLDIKYIRQQKSGRDITIYNVSLTRMSMIDPTTGWFEIVEIPTYDFNEVIGSNGEYVDKSFACVSQLFNNTCISRYPRPREVVFDNRS